MKKIPAYCTLILLCLISIYAKNPKPLQAERVAQIAQIAYFTNFNNAMKECFPKNYRGCGIDSKNIRYIDLTDGKRTERFFYIEGRFVPKNEIDSYSDYAPLCKESYPKTMPKVSEFSPTMVQVIIQQGRTENRRLNKKPGFEPIQNFIYDAANQLDTEQNLARVTLLGQRITVHYKIRSAVQNVDAKLNQAALTDPKVKRFVENPHEVTGYNWREIRDSFQRSSHSWGLSIDYIDQSPSARHKQVYWRWTKGFYDDDWVIQDIKKRWLPPDKVIAIFESEGFVWGGKWELWDNMHFEYHPEVIYMMNHRPF
ncbi:MAG: M15 family metallopeptidase [Treponemataceae bacterium]|nr:M15 family metallopeptidase [Treponemataceae bacterium]